MNRALNYFGGEKKYFIPFIVLFALYALLILNNIIIIFNILSYNSSYLIKGVAILSYDVISMLSIIALWLCVDKKIFFITYSLSVIAWVFIWADDVYESIQYTILLDIQDVNPFGMPRIIAWIICDAASLVALLLLWMKENKKLNHIVVPMVILFVLMSDLISNILNIKYCEFYGIIYSVDFQTIVYQILPCLLLIAVYIALWIPLNKFSICPKCSRRNNKTAGFCGGCGNKLK